MIEIGWRAYFTGNMNFWNQLSRNWCTNCAIVAPTSHGFLRNLHSNNHMSHIHICVYFINFLIYIFNSFDKSHFFFIMSFILVYFKGRVFEILRTMLSLELTLYFRRVDLTGFNY